MTDQASIAEARMAFERPGHPAPGGVGRSEGAMEHRLGSRMKVSLPVKLHHAGSALTPGRMLNVSLSGAYVQTSAGLKPLERIGILCERAVAQAAGAACVTAFVTRVAPDGVALEWLEFAPAVIRHLMRREQSQRTRRNTALAASRLLRAAAAGDGGGAPYRPDRQKADPSGPPAVTIAIEASPAYAQPVAHCG